MGKKSFNPQLGDAVKVKKGVMCPDQESIWLDGWQGRVMEIGEDGDKTLISIRWDSIALKNMSSEYIDYCEEEELDYTIMCLWLEEIEPAEPRDSEEDVQKVVRVINRGNRFVWLGDNGKRIQKILADVDEDDTMGEFNAWFGFLKENLQFPFTAVVSEYQERGPFRYGEKVVVKSLDLIDDFYGIIANLKKRDIPLCDLEVLDSSTHNYQPVHDYCVWFANR